MPTTDELGRNAEFPEAGPVPPVPRPPPPTPRTPRPGTPTAAQLSGSRPPDTRSWSGTVMGSGRSRARASAGQSFLPLVGAVVGSACAVLVWHLVVRAAGQEVGVLAGGCGLLAGLLAVRLGGERGGSAAATAGVVGLLGVAAGTYLNFQALAYGPQAREEARTVFDLGLADLARKAEGRPGVLGTAAQDASDPGARAVLEILAEVTTEVDDPTTLEASERADLFERFYERVRMSDAAGFAHYFAENVGVMFVLIGVGLLGVLLGYRIAADTAPPA